MRTTRIVALLAALALGTGLLAGCGSDDKEQYAEEVVDVLTPVGEALTTLGTELSASNSPEEYPELIREAQGAIDDGIADLEAIEVPEDLEDVNANLVSAFEDFSASLAEITDAADSGNLAKVQRATFALPDAEEEFEQRLNEVQQQAIDAGVPIEDSSE